MISRKKGSRDGLQGEITDELVLIRPDASGTIINLIQAAEHFQGDHRLFQISPLTLHGLQEKGGMANY